MPVARSAPAWFLTIDSSAFCSAIWFRSATSFDRASSRDAWGTAPLFASSSLRREIDARELLLRFQNLDLGFRHVNVLRRAGCASATRTLRLPALPWRFDLRRAELCIRLVERRLLFGAIEAPRGRRPA